MPARHARRRRLPAVARDAVVPIALAVAYALLIAAVVLLMSEGDHPHAP
jgi:hypothetical protein